MLVVYIYIYYTLGGHVVYCTLVHCYSTLQRFFSNLEQSETAQKSLVKRGLQFRDFLIKRFKWDFSEEPEEDAPTVVHGIEANDST